MSVTGTISVACPGCGASHECRLVQSINARTAPDDKQTLLAGDLNMLACGCGRRFQLAATVVFHDPDADVLYQVVPAEAEMAKAEELMRSVGGSGARRLLPSLNALVEKVKILDAGLDDRAIEMTKVLLLASRPQPDLDLVLLFQSVDREAGAIHWLLFEPESDVPLNLASPVSGYERLLARAQRATGMRIDRAWAVAEVQAMIAAAN
ncbi:MAG: CpXC domain-containing protein [Kofleriaceae bacterium]|nr:CpXC domain-containing protein [Kofleriaceae bacterium]